MSNDTPGASTHSHSSINYCLVSPALECICADAVMVWEGMKSREFVRTALSSSAAPLPQAGYHHVACYIPGGCYPKTGGEIDVSCWSSFEHYQQFTRDANALEADSERWSPLPNSDDPKTYYAIGEIPLRSSVSDRFPLLFEPMDSPSECGTSSPSALKNSNYRDCIAYNCPRETSSISLALLSEVFGKFAEECDSDPSQSQMEATYSMAALGFAEDLSDGVDEKELMKAFNKRFETLYDCDLTTYESDGHLIVNGRLQAVIEGKSRKPSGDPYVQGAAYYRSFYAQHSKLLETLPEGDVLPCFLITYIGPLISIYGMACVEKGQVWCEHLISVNASCHWTNDREMSKLVQVLYALRQAFDRLAQLTGLESPSSPPQKRRKFVRTVWPYPQSFAHLKSNTTIDFEYQERLPGEQYLFVVQPVNALKSEKLLAKFTRSYGCDVHKYLAQQNFAPDLLGFEELAGGWKMVIMEYLDKSIWMDGANLTLWNAAVQQGLLTVEQTILPLLREKKFVHGDIRLANLLFCVRDSNTTTNRPDKESTGLRPAVQVIDFDFAGLEGVARFPWNLNTENRPLGQVPFAPILFTHDTDSITALLNN